MQHLPSHNEFAAETSNSITLVQSTPIYRSNDSSSEILGRYPAGTRFPNTTETNGWYAIRFGRPYKGTTVAWIKASDLKRTNQSISSKSSTREFSRSGRFSLGFSGGYGLNNNFKVAGGIRVGVRTSSSFFLGGSFQYYMGTNTPELQTSSSVMHGAAEIGYDLSLARWLVLRPYLGIGYSMINVQVLGVPRSSGALTESGGLVLQFETGRFFASLDASALLIDGQSVISPSGLIGLYF